MTRSTSTEAPREGRLRAVLVRLRALVTSRPHTGAVRALVTNAVQVVGLGLVVTGVGMVYLPAALILGGLVMVLAAQGFAPPVRRDESQ